MVKHMTDFIPSKHGFHFNNSFANHVFDIGIASWTTYGLCGGMSFTSLDYYFAGMPIPTHVGSDFPNGSTPPENSALYKYIYDRLMDSFKANGSKFVSWTEKLDHSTWVWGKGVPELTKTEELPTLFQRIQSGQPVVLGLISATGISEIGNNHQVVAYGYELNEVNGDVIVYIYDNNNPNNVTTLKSNIKDLHSHFSSSYNDDWRGFFVENYSPKTPTYVDLCITKSLLLSTTYPQIGGEFNAKFTVKNLGEYAAHLQSLSITMIGPSGEDLEYMLGKDNNITDINPSEEREINRTTDSFGIQLGQYVLSSVYYSQFGHKITNIMTFSPENYLFSPTCPVVVTASRLSDKVLNEPPYVGQVIVMEALPNQTPIGFGQFNASSSDSCQSGVLKYSGYWKENLDNSRIFTVGCNNPIITSRRAYIFIRFNTRSIGSIFAQMRDNTVKLELFGTTPDNQTVSAEVSMAYASDSWGSFYWGSFKPVNSWTKKYILNMRIQGSDSIPHYERRSQPGDMIDSNPATLAKVDKNSPPSYPFIGYEPGIDYNHSISIAPVTKSMALDMYERNNSFDTATNFQLGMPVKKNNSWIAEYATVDGSNFLIPTKRVLNFDSVTDLDYFCIKYQSPKSDDDYQGDGFTTLLSDILDLHLIDCPPSISISLSNTNGNCPAIDIYTSEKKLLISVARGSHVSINNPTRSFPDKTFFVVIKNSDFASQGVFTYNISVKYCTAHQELKGSGSFYLEATDVKSILLRRYFDKINLSNPPHDSYVNIGDNLLQTMQIACAVEDTASLIRQTEKFLNEPANLGLIKSRVESVPQLAIAKELYNLAVIARSTGLIEDEERLYHSSSDLCSKYREGAALQTAILKELDNLSVRKIKLVEGKKIVKNVTRF